jgi:hypothetical protein
MPLIIEGTTLCPCLHINALHDNELACTAPGCKCQRFNATARTSSHHYQRGQRTVRKRVARLEPGDRVLVGFPGRVDLLRNEHGYLYELVDGVSRVKTEHVQDNQLRFVEKKTGALVATVTGRRSEAADYRSGFYGRRGATRHVIETDLGELPPTAGVNSVMVLA